jgi:alpha-1,4-digalacturonate transport system permease protein
VSGYEAAWDSANFSQYFINTAIVCVIATILTVGVSCCTGYALAKYDNKWLKAFFVGILATTMLPGEVMLAPLFLVVRDLGLYNSLAGIILPALLTATGCFMFRQFFLTVPDELIEAARIDGARELSIFLRIMVPISRPIMLTLAILSFQWRWNDYIWPLLMLNDPEKFTVQIGIQSLVGAQNINWSVLLGGSVISMVPLIVVFLVFQRYVMNADINAGLKD